jgi:PAS domain S-box-containing protein
MRGVLTLAEYRQLVHQVPAIVWRTDPTGQCDYFNLRWLAFTGRPLADELGDGWTAGVHPDDLERGMTLYRDHLAAREAFEIEYRLRRHDGVYRWMLGCGVPRCDRAGAFAGYLGSSVDVTERREAERELRRLQEMQRGLAEDPLPLCAGCKRARDGRGSWHRVERLLEESGAVSFTHTYCPSCERKIG